MDFGVSGLSDSDGADKFSVDFVSVTCDQTQQEEVQTKSIIAVDSSQFAKRGNSLVGLLMIVCLTTSLLSAPCSKRLDLSSRNHSPVTTFSSLKTHRPPIRAVVNSAFKHITETPSHTLGDRCGVINHLPQTIFFKTALFPAVVTLTRSWHKRYISTAASGEP